MSNTGIDTEVVSSRFHHETDFDSDSGGEFVAKSHASLVSRVATGAGSGLIATLPMTAFMLSAHRMLPPQERYPLPPRLITMRLARSLGIEQAMNEWERTLATGVAHFGYGATMGGIYAMVTGQRSNSLKVGVGFGLAVWAGSYLGLLPALGILRPATQHPVRRTALMVAAHVVWGLALGHVTNRIRHSAEEEES